MIEEPTVIHGISFPEPDLGLLFADLMFDEDFASVVGLELSDKTWVP